MFDRLPYRCSRSRETKREGALNTWSPHPLGLGAARATLDFGGEPPDQLPHPLGALESPGGPSLGELHWRGNLSALREQSSALGPP